jgi:4-hydroxybenzoyl-CoA reductase subunit beta
MRTRGISERGWGPARNKKMMRLPYFQYHAPRTVREAADLLAASPVKTMLIAGGTDLLPNMKRRQQVPTTLIGLRQIGELKTIQNGEGLTIGSGVTLADLVRDPRVHDGYRGLWQAAAQIATPQLRNMGTIGGNLCLDTRCNYYDQNFEWRKGINFCLKKDGDICWVAPGSSKCWAVQSSDLVPVMVAIGAKLRFASTLGERVVDAAGLYNDDGIEYLRKRPDELLVSIELPPTNGWRASYQKLRRRGAFDFPVLGVAACIHYDQDQVSNAKVVLGGIAPSPVEITEANTALVGKPLSEDQIQAAAEAAYIKARPLDNTDFVYQWRKQMARQYTLRALRDVAAMR